MCRLKQLIVADSAWRTSSMTPAGTDEVTSDCATLVLPLDFFNVSEVFITISPRQGRLAVESLFMIIYRGVVNIISDRPQGAALPDGWLCYFCPL